MDECGLSWEWCWVCAGPVFGYAALCDGCMAFYAEAVRREELANMRAAELAV